MSLRDQAGMTVIELLAGIIGFIVIFGAITEMTIVATHNQSRISQRVNADQRARPVMTSVMDGLRSGCVAPRVAPVQAGSTATQMAFISKAGSGVTLTPDRRVLTLVGAPTNKLYEQVFPATGGTPPVWTFSGTSITTPPTPGRMLMDNVTAPGNVAFRYYDYVNGQLNSTPLPVPLSSTNAARAAFVTVSLTVQPAPGTSSQDARSPITITDSTDLRLESAGQVTAVDNLPCM